jgi:hypothetical protein
LQALEISEGAFLGECELLFSICVIVEQITIGTVLVHVLLQGGSMFRRHIADLNISVALQRFGLECLLKYLGLLLHGAFVAAELVAIHTIRSQSESNVTLRLKLSEDQIFSLGQFKLEVHITLFSGLACNIVEAALESLLRLKDDHSTIAVRVVRVLGEASLVLLRKRDRHQPFFVFTLIVDPQLTERVTALCKVVAFGEDVRVTVINLADVNIGEVLPHVSIAHPESAIITVDESDRLLQLVGPQVRGIGPIALPFEAAPWVT